MNNLRVFAGRLAGMVVLGPDGESVGRVRDVILNIHDAKATVLGICLLYTSDAADDLQPV